MPDLTDPRDWLILAACVVTLLTLLASSCLPRPAPPAVSPCGTTDAGEDVYATALVYADGFRVEVLCDGERYYSDGWHFNYWTGWEDVPYHLAERCADVAEYHGLSYPALSTRVRDGEAEVDAVHRVALASALIAELLREGSEES